MPLSRFRFLLLGLLAGLPAGQAAAGTVPDTIATRADFEWFWPHSDAPLDTALRRLNHGLTLSRRASDIYGEIGYYNSLGWLQMRYGNLVEAQRYLTRALNRATTTREPHRLWQTYLFLGMTASVEADDERALAFYEKADAAVQRYGRVSAAASADVRVRVVTTHAQLGHRGQAQRLGVPVLALLRHQQDTLAEVSLRTNWASALLKTAPDSALLLLKPVYDLLKQGPVDSYEHVLADAIRLVALYRQGNCAVVLAEAPTVLARAEAQGLLESQVELLNTLAHCQTLVAPQQAPATLWQLIARQDSLTALNQADALARQRSRLDFAAQRAQIRELEQEHRITQLRAEREQTRTLILMGVALVLVILLGGAVVFTRRLRRSEAAARAANRTKDQLMLIIGHDLRGPVANFQQALPLVKFYAEHPDPAELRALADELEQRAQQFGSLLDNLLHWSRTQNNEVRNQPESVVLPEAVAGVLALYEPLASGKGIRLRREIPAPFPVVWADPKLLATVLRNLVANAVKFTPADGEVVIRAEITPAKRVLLRVSDTGVGMTAAQLATLFTVGADRSTRGTAGESGTGLGLLVCRHFVQLIGSELHVSSQPGQGTFFAFEVPVAEPVGVTPSDSFPS